MFAVGQCCAPFIFQDNKSFDFDAPLVFRSVDVRVRFSVLQNDGETGTRVCGLDTAHAFRNARNRRGWFVCLWCGKRRFNRNGTAKNLLGRNRFQSLREGDEEKKKGVFHAVRDLVFQISVIRYYCEALPADVLRSCFLIFAGFIGYEGVHSL